MVDPVDTVSVEVPVPSDVRVTLVGLSETDGPLGETEAARFTVFVNPPRLVRVMIEVVVDPGATERPFGLAEM